MKRKVENYDKNGNFIPDISKVTLPKELSDIFVRILYSND